MVRYDAPLRDYSFLLHEVFEVVELAEHLGYDGWDRDMIDMMMEEWGEVLRTNWLPVNAIGDTVGCTYENGKVTAPPGFKEAWDATTCLLYTSPSPRD